MKTKIKKLIFWIIVILFILSSAVFAIDRYLFTRLCEDEIIKKSNSPENTYQVTVLFRDCGATTSKSMIFNVRRRIFLGLWSPENTVLVVRGSGKASLNWIEDENVMLFFDKGTIIRSQDKFLSLKITASDSQDIFK